MWLTVVLVNAETPRFREPLDPFLILLAAVCARDRLRHGWASRSAGQRRARVSGLALARVPHGNWEICR